MAESEEEGASISLLQDLLEVLFCVQACKFYAYEPLRPGGDLMFNNIIMKCGWFVAQYKYAQFYTGFNDMRVNALRMLNKEATSEVMDVDAQRLIEHMIPHVLELNSLSAEPLPEVVFDVAIQNWCRAYSKLFSKRSGRPPWGGCRYDPCSGCGREVKTKWCSGCMVYKYCSRECQVGHYPTHRAICRAIIAHSNPPEGMRYHYCLTHSF
jgi:MYND finger